MHIMRLSPLGRISTVSRCHLEPLFLSGKACITQGSVLGNCLRMPSLIRKKSSQIRQRQQITRSSNVASKQWSEQGKWPLAILMAAERSGALPITSQSAVTVLEDFQALGSMPVQAFCNGVNTHIS